jgi:serine protease AprX
MRGAFPFRFFKGRILLGLVFCALGFLLGIVGFAISSVAQIASPSIKAKIAPQVLAETGAGEKAAVVILLADQADVSAAHTMRDQDARGWFVYNTLVEHAARTQADLRRFLESQGVAYQSFWAANMIVATADGALVESLAARPDVARIDSNNPVRWLEEPEVEEAGALAQSPNAATAVAWGVNNVNAPSLWAMGYNGAGMVIGNLDTGVRWTHTALKPKYRGWNGLVADHSYNWRDAIHSGGGICGPNTLAPCDDDGHGTHTTGTTVGDDGAGNQIGVAPGAKWIGCRNMNQGVGTPATYTECFQFMIAPTDLTGNNPNAALRPHVINNSWSCPASEGCSSGTLETIVNNTQAAGIFVAVSAGNSGPGCSSVMHPPSIYSASFSVGAYDANNFLASFSARGPSTYTPHPLKPNLSAPGVFVLSAVNDSDVSYNSFSGTSMAAPHVAGVVALLWSARPELERDIETTKAILQSTANPNVVVSAQTCGGTPSTEIPNNSFGYGRVDALAAFNASAPPSPTPTPTPSPAPSPTPSPSPTPGATPTPTPTPSPTPASSPTPPTALGNISARLPVETGDGALIGGFIVTGMQQKQVLVRAIGPSLELPGQLDNPTLELRDSSGALLQENDDWKNSANQQAIMNSGLAPDHDQESAIIATLPANKQTYTAIVRGADNTTGIGVVEIYDLDHSSDSELANISSRGLVQTGDNALFAGTIVVGQADQEVIIRALGPSLPVPGRMENPMLELRDSNGALMQENDNWVDSPNKQEIMNSGIPPAHDLESAILASLPANKASYTAIVRGVNSTTGIAVVEVYALE